MKIRKASRKDLPALAELAHRLFLESNAEHGGTFIISKNFIRLEIREFRKQMKKGKALFLLAEERGEAVGMLFAKMEKLDNIVGGGGFRGHLGLIYVKPGFRSRGIGTKLSEEARRWFREKGITYFSVSVLRKNKDAKKLYRWFGFRPHSEFWELKETPVKIKKKKELFS